MVVVPNERTILVVRLHTVPRGAIGRDAHGRVRPRIWEGGLACVADDVLLLMACSAAKVKPLRMGLLFQLGVGVRANVQLHHARRDAHGLDVARVEGRADSRAHDDVGACRSWVGHVALTTTLHVTTQPGKITEVFRARLLCRSTGRSKKSCKTKTTAHTKTTVQHNITMPRERTLARPGR